MHRASIDLDELASQCYAAVLSDVCDRLGRPEQTAAPRIRPLTVADTVLVGWARTVHSTAVEAAPERHYGAEIDFIDSLRPGDVVVATVDAPAAFWGELFSCAATGRGARGTVVDGLVRDVARIEPLGYPVWATGTRPTDSLGRISITATDQPVSCGDVAVASGDLVVADQDGITFVPGDIAHRVVEMAVEKASTESKAKELLLSGATLGQAWERFRVL